MFDRMISQSTGGCEVNRKSGTCPGFARLCTRSLTGSNDTLRTWRGCHRCPLWIFRTDLAIHSRGDHWSGIAGPDSDSGLTQMLMRRIGFRAYGSSLRSCYCWFGSRKTCRYRNWNLVRERLKVVRTERSGAGATGDVLFGHSRRLSASWWPVARCQDIWKQNYKKLV